MGTTPDSLRARTAKDVVPRRELTATILGTVLEWYDFAVYAALAAVIGPLFFPEVSPATSVLLALATFGVSFAVRPLGAAILGGLADRSGRRVVLVISMLLMGGASLAIGLLPTYADIGVLAFVLLVLRDGRPSRPTAARSPRRLSLTGLLTVIGSIGLQRALRGTAGSLMLADGRIVVGSHRRG